MVYRRGAPCSDCKKPAQGSLRAVYPGVFSPFRAAERIGIIPTPGEVSCELRNLVCHPGPASPRWPTVLSWRNTVWFHPTNSLKKYFTWIMPSITYSSMHYQIIIDHYHCFHDISDSGGNDLPQDRPSDRRCRSDSIRQGYLVSTVKIRNIRICNSLNTGFQNLLEVFYLENEWDNIHYLTNFANTLMFATQKLV